MRAWRGAGLVVLLVSTTLVVGAAPAGAAPVAEPAPMAVAAAPTQVLSAGLSHTCAIRTTGAVTCWGGDLQGQSEVPAGTFTQVSGTSSNSATC